MINSRNLIYTNILDLTYFASKGIRWLSKPKVSYCNCVPEQHFVNLATLITRDINLTCYNVNIYYK